MISCMTLPSGWVSFYAASSSHKLFDLGHVAYTLSLSFLICTLELIIPEPVSPGQCEDELKS